MKKLMVALTLLFSVFTNGCVLSGYTGIVTAGLVIANRKSNWAPTEISEIDPKFTIGSVPIEEIEGSI